MESKSQQRGSAEIEAPDRFSSRLALILGGLGMAIGVGNIWRFPRMLAKFEEGGGTWLGGFATGIIVGALVGAGVMLLSAPDRGEVTRRRIGRRFRDIQEDARGHIEDMGEEAGHQIQRQRRRLKRRLRRRH